MLVPKCCEAAKSVIYWKEETETWVTISTHGGFAINNCPFCGEDLYPPEEYVQRKSRWIYRKVENAGVAYWVVSPSGRNTLGIDSEEAAKDICDAFNKARKERLNG